MPGVRKEGCWASRRAGRKNGEIGEIGGFGGGGLGFEAEGETIPPPCHGVNYIYCKLLVINGY
jgi:hypothetical protein